MERVWIGIGSNLLNPKYQVNLAVRALSQLPMTKIIACSSQYRSFPLGFLDQPDFLNMVIVLDTYLNPEKLLFFMKLIEYRQGRLRCGFRWKSRTLDLDILLFGQRIICNSILTVPHYDMLNRAFVIYPLLELDCNFIFPNGNKVTDYINIISNDELDFWGPNEKI